MGDGGHTTGIWVGEGEDVLERVDERLGAESRSEWIKDAMRLRLAVDEVLADAQTPYATKREKRAFVRQILLDAVRSNDDS